MSVKFNGNKITGLAISDKIVKTLKVNNNSIIKTLNHPSFANAFDYYGGYIDGNIADLGYQKVSNKTRQFKVYNSVSSARATGKLVLLDTF